MKLNISKNRLKEIIKEEVESFVETIHEEAADDTDKVSDADLKQVIRQEVLKALSQK
tara:strand:+ start:240 stop:410 length:171 start_codon:yes stop_codon:yes gene_type:complete